MVDGGKSEDFIDELNGGVFIVHSSNEICDSIDQYQVDTSVFVVEVIHRM